MGNKHTIPDVVELIKNRNKASNETAASASLQRKLLQKSPDIVQCVLGPVGGPYKRAMYSEDAHMFMPVFKE